MKDIVNLAIVLLSAVVGLPCLCLGAAGVMGTLADVSYAENLKLAVPYLAVASLLAVITIGRIGALGGRSDVAAKTEDADVAADRRNTP